MKKYKRNLECSHEKGPLDREHARIGPGSLKIRSFFKGRAAEQKYVMAKAFRF